LQDNSKSDSKKSHQHSTYGTRINSKSNTVSDFLDKINQSTSTSDPGKIIIDTTPTQNNPEVNIVNIDYCKNSMDDILAKIAAVVNVVDSTRAIVTEINKPIVSDMDKVTDQDTTNIGKTPLSSNVTESNLKKGTDISAFPVATATKPSSSTITIISPSLLISLVK